MLFNSQFNIYNEWISRQLKIEYEIKKQIEEFNEFRKLNNNLF